MNEPDTVYAIRLSLPFTHALVNEHARLETLLGPAPADQWAAGLMEGLRRLATLPQRCPIAPEDRLLPKATVRQWVYQPRRAGPSWRILFTVQEADQDDPPIVWAQLLRHGAQAPLTLWPPEEPDAA